MDFDTFQVQCGRTAIYQKTLKTKMERLSYVTLGLTSEAGEVAGKLKKVMRDQNGYLTEDDAAAVASEVGDVLWYCAMVLEEIGYGMDECVDMVVAKLESRQERGVLGGSGDNR